MLNLLQHPALVVGMLHLFHLHDLLLLENLDGIEPLVMLGLDEMDPTKAAGAKGPLDGEIRQGILPLGDAVCSNGYSATSSLHGRGGSGAVDLGVGDLAVGDRRRLLLGLS